MKFNLLVDITAWIAAGAAAGTFALEPVLNLIRSGRRARAYARLDQLLDLREKVEQHGVSTPHLVAATDESVKVVRDRIVMSELGFAIRKGRKSRGDRIVAWLLVPASLILLAWTVIGPTIDGGLRVPAWLYLCLLVLLVLVFLTTVVLAVGIEVAISFAVRRFVADAYATLPHDFLAGGYAADFHAVRVAAGGVRGLFDDMNARLAAPVAGKDVELVDKASA